jgi:hypothetical protein
VVEVTRVQLKFDPHLRSRSILIDAPRETIWKLLPNLIDLVSLGQMWEQEREQHNNLLLGTRRIPHPGNGLSHSFPPSPVLDSKVRDHSQPR